MPTYVYQCRTCDKSFEAEQSIKDAPLTDCECGGNVRRIIQPVGIAFKGSGFYVNDSVSKPVLKDEAKTSPVDSAPVAPPVAPAPTASETKTEAS